MSKTPSPLRVALVGCGIISEDHVRGYAQHTDRARIVACCDIDAERAARRAAQVGDARVVTRYEELLSDPEIDAIELCTPHHLHTDAVIAAAQVGKQILCQKPLAKTLAECDAMIAAAEKAGVTLFYAEMNRTLPAAVQARKAVDEGKIGRLVGIQATAAHWQGGVYLSTAWRYNPAISGGGQLLDGGIHALDLMLHIGGPIHSVTCFTTQFRPELGGEDTSVVNARFEGGHLGSMFSSQAAGVWFPGAHCIVFGTEGVLSIGGHHGALALHRHDLPGGTQALIEHRTDTFAEMIGRYLDTVVDGAPSASPPSVGRENLQLVLAAYRSQAEGREVRLSEIVA